MKWLYLVLAAGLMMLTGEILILLTSERTVHNDYVFIGILWLAAIGFLYFLKKYLKE